RRFDSDQLHQGIPGVAQGAALFLSSTGGKEVRRTRQGRLSGKHFAADLVITFNESFLSRICAFTQQD
ncbi:MAG TPA: hypothetical protein PK120_09020, partial [Syntrophales bacterium]|nr:hypothetical protein [Syntrophales bacterium]